MYVVLGATLCVLIDIIQTSTLQQSTNVTTTSNMTELERSMKETETILEALERAVHEARVLFQDNNITIDVRNIDSNKEDYRNVLLQLLANNTVSGDGNTTREEGAGGEKTLTAARRQKELKLKLFDFVALSKKKRKHKDNQRETNRIIMQGKIDEWLLNRELEKKKIKNYIDRVRVAKLEKCYREGVSKKKKRKKTRRQNEDDEDGEEKKKSSRESDKKKKKREKRKKRQKEKYKGGNMYPCCRKCCKRSYMGCL